MSDYLKKLQDFDSLSEAEKMTGKSYKNDDSTIWLGMALLMENSKEKERIYDETGDTKFCNSVEDYIHKIQSIGFELVYQEPFTYFPDYGDKKPLEESMYVFSHKEYGIIIYFDTYTGDVNAAKMYYNWSPNGVETYGLTSSGSFMTDPETEELALFEPDMLTPYRIEGLPKIPKWDSGKYTWEEFSNICEPIHEERSKMLKDAINEGKRILWCGNHDGREGIKSIINRLVKNGKFFQYWHECAFSWICPFPEFKGDRNLDAHYSATILRLTRFPSQVLKQIGKYR